MSVSAPVILLPAALHRFVELVLGDPALQARLGAVLEADAFVAEASAVAAEHGVPLDAEVLAGSLRPDPLGMGRFGPAPIELGAWPPQGWLPTRSVPTGGAPAFDWLWFGDRPLSRSFYEDEVRQASALPLNWLLRIRTGMDALLAGAGREPELSLTGLIYHMSRCGSTLLGRMLGAVPENEVTSEPEPLDAVLLWTWREQVPIAEAVPGVRAMVAALSRQRGTGAERLFIKTDAWHTLSLPLLRAAFPDTPWVYLFRDPTEVLVSHQRMAGMQTVAGVMPEALFGIARGNELPPLEYAARALDAIGRGVLGHWDLGGGRAVDYPDVAAAATGRIAAHFGLDLSAAQCDAMRAAAGFDAKNPDRRFVDDRAAKLAEADPTVAKAARFLAETHTRLLDRAG